jgi:hypothetical protein
MEKYNTLICDKPIILVLLIVFNRDNHPYVRPTNDPEPLGSPPKDMLGGAVLEHDATIVAYIHIQRRLEKTTLR